MTDQPIIDDANPDAPPVLPPPPDDVVPEDGRRKYQYVATYHGPSDILEIPTADGLQLMRDVPTDIEPAHVEAVEEQQHVTVEHISLVDETPAPRKTKKKER